METQTKIYVVDEMMGRGKTSAAINYINNAPSKKKFLYITPFISEVERIKGCCKKKDFKEPSEKKYGSKLRSIKYLLNDRSTYIYRFFEGRGIVMDQDGFALSEMLQFIWRSAVRDEKEIWVYIPSRRMRNLLERWIEKVSAREVNNEQRI